MNEDKEIKKDPQPEQEAKADETGTPQQAPAQEPEAEPQTKREAEPQGNAKAQPQAEAEEEHKKEKKKRPEAEHLKKELDDIKDRLLRTAAEFDNYRKRTEREKQSSVAFGAASAVTKLLPVLDNLERAAEADSADEEYKKGVLLTLDQFQKALSALGVQEIEALGSEFDPAVHNAVMREAAGDKRSGTVTKVLQKGYRMGDRVLRPAMVAVAE
ncbi:MAG: nucleotide exchange factor GrpE [Oscillospiraceae bacterium]|nr:nucleotide exchange factor GrpE [Oscillospiraceae bacterium]